MNTSNTSLRSFPIVTLVGYAGCGKDTVAAILVEEYGFSSCAFADGVRWRAKELNRSFDITDMPSAIIYLDENGNIGADIPKENLGVKKTVTYNELLNKFGYEMAKRYFPVVREYLVEIGHGERQKYPYVWIDKVLPSDLNLTLDLNKPLCVRDGRYKNEGKRTQMLGGVVWRIDRSGVGPINMEEHESVPKVRVDAVIFNTGDLNELRLEVRRVFDHQCKLCSIAVIPRALCNLELNPMGPNTRLDILKEFRKLVYREQSKASSKFITLKLGTVEAEYRVWPDFFAKVIEIFKKFSS